MKLCEIKELEEYLRVYLSRNENMRISYWIKNETILAVFFASFPCSGSFAASFFLTSNYLKQKL